MQRKITMEKIMDVKKIFSEIQSTKTREEEKRDTQIIVETALQKGLSYKEIYEIMRRNGYNKSFSSLKKEFQKPKKTQDNERSF